VVARRADASRYPYDPVCDWGRVADGRGMLVRCLSQAESASLRKAASSPPASGQPEQPGVPPAAADTGVEATVGPVVVESGGLPEAERKLQTAKQRFAQCVEQNGGLTRADGEVQVKFLVRERGRAEGVQVAKWRSMSKSAAQCVADVVDRRSVGLPDAPIVAATLTVKFKRQTR